MICRASKKVIIVKKNYQNERNNSIRIAEKFNFLKKIMDDSDEILPQDSLTAANEKLHQEVDLFCEWIKESSIHNKDKYILELYTALHKTDILRKHHQMIGDFFIGVVGTETNFLDKMVPMSYRQKMNELVRKDTDIPMILTKDPNFSVSVSTVYDRQIDMKLKELSELLMGIKEVDISKIINYIYVCDPRMGEYTTTFYFPALTETDESHVRQLVEMMNICVTSWNSTRSFSNCVLDSFIESCIKSGKPLYISVISQTERVSAQKKVKKAAKRMKLDYSPIIKNTVIIKSEQEIKKEVEERIGQNHAYRNYAVFEAIEKIMTSIFIELIKANQIAKTQNNKSSTDGVYMEDDPKTLDSNKALVGAELQRQYRRTTEALDKLNGIYRNLKSRAGNVEAQFKEIACKNLKVFGKIHELGTTVDDWVYIAIGYGIADMYDKNRKFNFKAWGMKYVEKIANAHDDREHLLRNLYKKLNGERVAEDLQNDKNQEKSLSNIPMIRLAFLLGDELGLMEEDLIQAAGMIIEPQTAKEFYYRGCFLEENDLFEDAYYRYRQSLYYSKWIDGKDFLPAKNRIKNLIKNKHIDIREEEQLELLSSDEIIALCKKDAEEHNRFLHNIKIAMNSCGICDKENMPQKTDVSIMQRAQVCHEKRDYKGEFDLLAAQMNADAQYKCGKLLYNGINHKNNKSYWRVMNSYFMDFDKLFSPYCGYRNFSIIEEITTWILPQCILKHKRNISEEQFQLYQMCVDIKAFFLRAYKLGKKGKPEIIKINNNLMEILDTKHKDIVNLNEATMQDIQRLKYFGKERSKKLIEYRQGTPFFRLSDFKRFPGNTENVYRQIIEKAIQNRIIIEI